MPTLHGLLREEEKHSFLGEVTDKYCEFLPQKVVDHLLNQGSGDCLPQSVIDDLLHDTFQLDRFSKDKIIMTKLDLLKKLRTQQIKRADYLKTLPRDIQTFFFNEYIASLDDSLSFSNRLAFGDDFDLIEWFLFEMKPGFSIKDADSEGGAVHTFNSDEDFYDYYFEKKISTSKQPDLTHYLLDALKESRRELHACQAVIHLAGGFDPAYVTGAQASLKRTDALIAKCEKA